MASYILKKTRASVEMIDPTGNAPWFPSHEALEKNCSFGTGNAEPAAVAMLQKKYKQLVRSLELTNQVWVSANGGENGALKPSSQAARG